MLTPEDILQIMNASHVPGATADEHAVAYGEAIEAAATAPLLERIAELEALSERLKIEAQCHAQEARTANATIAEIYQLCSGRTGEPGNWHGAEPVRQKLAELEAKLAQRVRVQDCWKLVPLEPTKAMRRAGGDYFSSTEGHWNQVVSGTYRVMLSAAPAAPEQQEPAIKDAVKRSCPLCEESWYEFAEGAVAQAPNAQQAEPVTKEMWRKLAESQAELLSMATTQQAEAQPVARIRNGSLFDVDWERLAEFTTHDLYTAQPKAVPLTDHAAFSLIDSMGWSLDDTEKDDMLKLLRATEAAHGIGTGD